MINQSPFAQMSLHWRRWTLVFWIITACVMVALRWPQIHFFVLADTDDNMRMMQVRALVNGQDWFDLRQYRLDPPGGADIHWSRFVDLPLAALILILKPLIGMAAAEKAAIAVAPLLPLGISFFALGYACRRLIGANAWLLSTAMLICASATIRMFMPTRIDHHGWQLAFLAVILAGLASPQKIRGGMTVGLATALSLVVGLEMLPYLAVAGAMLTLIWVWDSGEMLRLRGYAVALGGGTALGYLGFASYANRVARCDALSPVWLSVMVLAGALLFLATFIRTDRTLVKLGMAGAAGAIVLIVMHSVWPNCLSRPEGISPELYRLWFQNISEVKPLHQQKLLTALSNLMLPLSGLIGCAWFVWAKRGQPSQRFWLPITILLLISTVMMFWQTRAAPAAQLFAIPGAAALAWAVLPKLSNSRHFLLRTFGVVGALLAITGLAVPLVFMAIPEKKPTAIRAAVTKASGQCTTLSKLRPITQLPAATILTFVDLGPRLITVTHHNAIAGPYHRNGAAIIDVHHAFDGTADEARTIARKHGATLVLICPNFAESTIYRTRSPKGFYVQLAKGQVPDWLTPVPLPTNSPFMLWRVVQ
ncbi:MAG: AcrB/AcrD/AcrF family protein [Chakrabartia sp.]